jgi:parallel beta-helix repeat protein
MATTLLPDELERMTPVLGSLARLLARGLEPGEAEFRALLLGAGLEPEPARMDEVGRWARLLAQAREDASELTLGAIVEALMLRGLAEASAALAVATVTSARVGEGNRTQQRAGTGLHASVNSLDFGVLAPGQAARGSLDVRGGPGRVVSQSEQVRVRPEQFGPEPTRLLVEVEPLVSGLLWSTLTLSTPQDALEVPVLARWDDSQLSDGPAEPCPTFVIAPDGSGTHDSLAEAIASAAPGTTIRLERGVHVLDQGLLLQQSVTLIGAGIEATELVAEHGACVLGYDGSGLFQLSDLTVRWVGPESAIADVVAVRGGELQIERCRFAGAPATRTHLGAGLQISGKVHGVVRSCRMEANGVGIEVLAEANPVLENNRCQENRGPGIRYAGEAGGMARANVCSGNGYDGIAVERSARPLVETSTCQRNGWSGIGCYAHANATIRRNTCSGNQHSGIHVGAEALPTLEENACRENGDSGISYTGSGGAAVNNRCVGNRKYGICVDWEGEPVLENNDLRDNGDSGIAYFGHGAGTARHNTSSGNGHYGIYVGDQAHPMLEANLCQANAWSGLAYFGSAGGRALGNRCNGNGRRGLFVSERARPVLEDNTYRGNVAASYVGPSCSPSK